jgi:thiol-disulfide isomerase/thioredoxin
MKNTPFTFLIFIALISLWSCSNNIKENSSIQIRGVVQNTQGKTVSIISMDPLREMIDLGESNIDSKGNFQIAVESIEPMEVLLIYGGESAEMWLEPGFNLALTFDGSDFKNTIEFKGKGAVENTFLNEMSTYNQKYAKEPKDDIEEFRTFMKSYTSGAEQRVNSLAAKKNVSELFVVIEKNKIKNRFPSSFYQFFKNYWYENSKMFELQENEKDVWKDLDLQNNKLLISDNHRRTVYDYISNLTFDSARFDPSGSRVIGKKKAMNYFLSRDMHPDYIQFVTASNISDDLEYPGYKYAKPKYDIFLLEYPESRFTKALENKFSKWFELTKGKSAPDFSGLSPDGQNVSLSDFKGSVIYIDVWASWCRPCFSEFPYLVDLKNTFSDKDKVIFMYASIDEDSSYWRNGLKKIPEIEGVHLMVDGAWQSQFAEEYIIRNIPRYILIDQQGKIVDAEAKKPSTGEGLANDIRSLLE